MLIKSSDSITKLINTPKNINTMTQNYSTAKTYSIEDSNPN